MLILTRKKGESILLTHPDITFKIFDIGSRSVRVGIEAPKAVSIFRDEILERFDKGTLFR